MSGTRWYVGGRGSTDDIGVSRIGVGIVGSYAIVVSRSLVQSQVGLQGSACFFFQAEDGIRDVAVTGVQTCALPISRHLGGVGAEHLVHPRGENARVAHLHDAQRLRHIARLTAALGDLGEHALRRLMRSEEHTSELQSRLHLVCRLLLEKKYTARVRV